MTHTLHNAARYAVRGLFRDNRLCDRLVRELHRNERLAPEELDRLTDRWLLRSLKAASARIAHYGRLRITCSERDVREFLRERVSVVAKDDLIRDRADFYPDGGRLRAWSIVGKTSGTTGSPLQTIRSPMSVIWANAFKKRHWTWSDFRPGLPVATLRGDMVVPIDREMPPFWFHDRYNNNLIFSSRHLRPDCIDAIIDRLAQFRPYILEAYPSTAYELARYLAARGRHIEIPYVYTGSEPLYAGQRQLIAQQFQTTIMDHYGMAERVAYATECEHGNLHLNTDYSFVEIVDGAGRPTSDYGFVVGTTYHNLTMPLLRYRLNDKTKWKPGRCACGRTYPMIESVLGKYEDTIYASNGAPVSASLVTFVFKDMQHIERSQVAQTGEGKWEVRIVPATGFSQSDRERLLRGFRETVDPDLEVAVVLADDIPRTDSGKYRWVVNEYRTGASGDQAPRTETIKERNPA